MKVEPPASEPGAQRVLEVSGVEHGFGRFGPRWKIDGLTLSAGESVACVGPSGSGKTTLLELLAGLQTPQSGQVRALGADWNAHPLEERQARRLQNFGLVFQGFELMAALTVRENILLPLRLLGLREKEFHARLERHAERVGLENLLKRKPAKLSHGERQRVALCRALIHRPKVILADEPTANLDAQNSARAFELLHSAVRDEGAAMVCVTHDPELVRRFGSTWSMDRFWVPNSAGEVAR